MPPKSNQYSQGKLLGHVFLFALLLVGNVSAYDDCNLATPSNLDPCGNAYHAANSNFYCGDDTRQPERGFTAGVFATSNYDRAQDRTFPCTVELNGRVCTKIHADKNADTGHLSFEHLTGISKKNSDGTLRTATQAAELCLSQFDDNAESTAYATYREQMTKIPYSPFQTFTVPYKDPFSLNGKTIEKGKIVMELHNLGSPRTLSGDAAPGENLGCAFYYSELAEVIENRLYGYNKNIAEPNNLFISNAGLGSVAYECLPPPAPPTAAPTATHLFGDAHFLGPHGDRTDFKGRNNTYYNVLSTNNLSVAVLFMHDTYNWRNKVVFGSWMKAMAVSAMTTENKLVKAAYHCERPAMMEVDYEGEDGSNGQFTLGSDFIFEQVEVSLSKDYVFAVSNGEWEVEAKNSYLPYKFQNVHKKRLDVNLKTIANVDLNPVAPHGLIGQAWDRDDKMVIGALDDYQKQGRVVETSAMAEGAIEGSAVDYEIDPRDRFSTKFKYSRFGLKRAAPRDVSLLSGMKLSAKKTASAGAMNDEDNEA